MHEVKIKTHHVTLPLCASSFSDHAGCPGHIQTVTSLIKCDCEFCHGADAKPEAICQGCHSSMTAVVHDNPIHVGEDVRFSRSTSPYCDDCRAEFMADHNLGGAVRP